MNNLDLIVFNYRMDENDQVFSHQLQVVNCLATKFQNVTVISAKVGSYLVPNNVQVIDIGWKEGQSFKNAFRFLLKSIPIVVKHRNGIIFSHMTERFSILITPFARVLRIKHVLWYAHAKQNPFLWAAYIGVNQIVSSTTGSFPFQGKKITYIGQGINTKDFIARKPASSIKLDNLIHIGRLDKSKNIVSIIEFADKLRHSNQKLTLTIIGKHINIEDSDYISNLQILLASNQDWVNYFPGLPRRNIPEYLSLADLFVHLFEGSLDKTLIEATLTGIPVLTVNKEYLRIFGSWSQNSTNKISLESEYSSLHGCSLDSLNLELERRLIIAREFHGFDQWCQNLSATLCKS